MDAKDVTFSAEGLAEVVVHVPARAPNHSGYWALGRHFPEGRTVVTVSPLELERLLQQPVIAVTTKAATLAASPLNGASSESITEDEAAHLRQYREALELGLTPAFLSSDEVEALQQLRSLAAPAVEAPKAVSAQPAPQREAAQYGQHHGKKRGR